MTEAARVWFILQHFGVAARVVNGGWPALQSALPQWEEPGDVPPTASVAYKALLGRQRRLGRSGRHEGSAWP